MAGFLLNRKISDGGCAGEEEAVSKAVRKTMKEQRKKQQEGFLTFLEDCVRMEASENIDLEQVFNAFDEDPEIFQQHWLRPLLAAGLNLDRACEVVLESILRPN